LLSDKIVDEAFKAEFLLNNIFSEKSDVGTRSESGQMLIKLTSGHLSQQANKQTNNPRRDVRV
jgi:hypothetical protein